MSAFYTWGKVHLCIVNSHCERMREAQGEWVVLLDGGTMSCIPKDGVQKTRDASR